MGKEERDWYRNRKGKHPSSCNCADCTQRRLGRTKSTGTTSTGAGCLIVVLAFIVMICLLSSLACTQTNSGGATSNQSSSCFICGRYLSSQSPDVSMNVNKNGTFRITYSFPGQPRQSVDGYWEDYNGGMQTFTSTFTSTMTKINVQYRMTFLTGAYNAGLNGNRLMMGLPSGSETLTTDVWIKQ